MTAAQAALFAETFPEPERLIVTDEAHRSRVRVDAYPADLREGRRWQAAHGGRLLRLTPTIWWKPQEPRAYPLRIGRRLLVVTSEEQRTEWQRRHPDRIVLRIPSELAFGTGEHATTRLCLREVVALSPAAACLDAGCGTGILAVAARRLGCPQVEGFDFDPVAVRVSRANAAANGATVRFSVKSLDAWRPVRTHDLVVANIFSDLLIRNAPRLAAAVARGGHLVLSGIRDNQVAAVTRAFRPLRRLRARRSEGWCCLVFVK